MLPETQTFLLAMMPVGELRLSLPMALAVYDLDLFTGFFISVIGNLIPVILILLLLEPVSSWLSRNFVIFNRFFTWLFARTRTRYTSQIKKYGSPALILFVALPLPITGAWTGSLIAFLFAIPFKKAFPLIALGVVIAGLIVLSATQAGITIEKYFGWQILISIILVLSIVYWLYNNKNNN